MVLTGTVRVHVRHLPANVRNGARNVSQGDSGSHGGELWRENALHGHIRQLRNARNGAKCDHPQKWREKYIEDASFNGGKDTVLALAKRHTTLPEP